MLGVLASLAERRPWWVIAAAAVAVAPAAVLGISAVDRLHPYSAADPSAESSIARQHVHEEIGIDPGAGLVALVELPPRGIDSAVARRRVDRIADRIFLDPAIGWVTTYYSQGDSAMVSRDERGTYVVANFAARSDKAQQRSVERLRERLDGQPGLVGFGGEAAGYLDGAKVVAADIARAEAIAFPLIFLLALWFFRGLVAAMLPVAVGALALPLTLAGLRIANEVQPISIFALNLALALSLALALNYSLLVVSRYREELAGAGGQSGALERTMRTAGRTVAFSSVAIAVALAALLLFPQRFLYSMGIAGALVALIAGAASLTVLPATLALLGQRINALAPRALRRAAAREARPESAGSWYRLSRFVTRRPRAIAVASGLLLLALGAPFLQVKFAPADATGLPRGTESREVREALDERFPKSTSLPLFVVLDGAAPGQAEQFAARAKGIAGVQRVDPPRRIGGGRRVITVAVGVAPNSERAERLVGEIRAIDAPFDTWVGGVAADFLDQKAAIRNRLPLVMAVLLMSTLALLFAMTGSVVLPLKAVAMNLLTICAALGLLVLVFQDGRLEGLLGYQSPGTLELSQPLVLLAVVFGASTDYGVFLLSRIREAKAEGLSDAQAVARGLERTGRIITAAALIVCVALGAFATSQIVFIKELGIGIAAAVVLDATVVRALLVPSLMMLLGRWNWWSPAPMRRLHGRLGGAGPT